MQTDELTMMFEEWKEKRLEKTVQEIPECVNQRFIGKDRPLKDGNLKLPQGQC